MFNIELKTLMAVVQLKENVAFIEFMRWVADTANEMGLNTLSMSPDPEDANFDIRHHFMRGCASAMIALNELIQTAEEMIEERKRLSEASQFNENQY